MKSPGVLIVEDDPRWREGLKNLLSRLGYSVTESEGEKEALKGHLIPVL
jgi:CheY-like chemotaxis protein